MLTTLRNKPRYRAISLYSGLGSRWKLDEESGTRDDFVGTNDWADNNTVTFAAGLLGNAARFTAANSEYLSFTEGDQGTTTKFTWACWVKFRDLTDIQGILVKDDGAIYRIDKGTSHELRFFISTSSNSVRSATGAIALDTWAFVAFVYDGTLTGNTNRAKIWKDTGFLSLPTETGTIPASFTNGVEVVLAGALAPTLSPANLDMDEVGYWPARALTSDELTLLYNGGTPLIW